MAVAETAQRFRERSWGQVLRGALSPRKIGAIYVWIAAIILFSVIKPDLFLTMGTLKILTSQSAIPAMAAMAILIPLACGAFDLSIGANIGLAAIVFSMCLRHPGTPLYAAILLTLLAGLAVATANIVFVVFFEVNPFIGTLATGAIIDAVGQAISGDQFVTFNPPSGWNTFATGHLFGIEYPFYYLLIITVGLGYLLERTKTGRYLYAVGFDRETSRLTGLPVPRLRALGFLTSGLLGAFIGMLFATQIASSAPGGGDAFLLPAFSAAFLGATQIRPGRFNPWGTFVAVFLLATGSYGITLIGGQGWTTQAFQGAALLIAISLAEIGGNRFVSLKRGKGMVHSIRTRLSTRAS